MLLQMNIRVCFSKLTNPEQIAILLIQLDLALFGTCI
uniref:Uncharacterized protein n=1 Tax=Arundo donax TaxID=35708 RepID=A0A0A8Y667_ARUDO